MLFLRYRALFNPDRPAVFVRLLRSRNAALVLCFLQESFKAVGYAPEISGEKLVGLLADFLDTN